MDLIRYKKIIELRKSGSTFESIAKTFGVSRQRVQQIIKVGIVTPKKYICELCDNADFDVRVRKFCQVCTDKISKFQGRDRTREIVRIRDKHTCQDCKKVWKEGDRRFDIHHLNGKCGKMSRGYDSEHNLTGLITLCHKCHFNRPEHASKK